MRVYSMLQMAALSFLMKSVICHWHCKLSCCGSCKILKFDLSVRLISATHKNLEKAVENGEFREDLYYSLKVVPLDIPSLVDRQEDIPVLAEHFLTEFSKKHNQDKKKFSLDAIKYLLSMPWSGNVRQLINVIDLCATLSKNKNIPLSLVKSAVHDEPVHIQTLKEAKQAFEKGYLLSVLRMGMLQMQPR